MSRFWSAGNAVVAENGKRVRETRRRFNERRRNQIGQKIILTRCGRTSCYVRFLQTVSRTRVWNALTEWRSDGGQRKGRKGNDVRPDDRPSPTGERVGDADDEHRHGPTVGSRIDHHKPLRSWGGGGGLVQCGRFEIQRTYTHCCSPDSVTGPRDSSPSTARAEIYFRGLHGVAVLCSYHHLLSPAISVVAQRRDGTVFEAFVCDSGTFDFESASLVRSVGEWIFRVVHPTLSAETMDRRQERSVCPSY